MLPMIETTPPMRVKPGTFFTPKSAPLPTNVMYVNWSPALVGTNRFLGHVNLLRLLVGLFGLAQFKHRAEKSLTVQRLAMERLIFNQRAFSIRCPFARRVICAFTFVLSVIHI